VAEPFIKETKVTRETIGGRKLKPGPVTQAPVLEGFDCWFEARVVERMMKGDHTIFFGEVVEASIGNKDAQPLVLASTGWNYGG
jgi:flavin reductase (DIM6/NTAB) family NADH-FMN oxidoreductase RutF